MNNIMIRFLCLLSVLLSLFVSASPALCAAGADETSYFSTPDEADAAAAAARDAAVSESENAAREVAAVESEVKAAKGEVRAALHDLAAAKQRGRTEKLSAARERLEAARTNLDKTEKRAGKAVSAITSVKASTISSMRSQNMSWSEIARELGAAKETLAPAASLNRDSTQREPGAGIGKGNSGDRKGGTMRDLVSGISKTPGAVGGKGDIALGLSRVSAKAKSGSKDSRTAESVAALGGRGNAPTEREVASISAAISKARAKLSKMKSRAAVAKAKAIVARSRNK
ncbi:hypothetical protein [Desulfovibrio sp. JC010]|uniref:hypothetical protein n=1 Tax=Desulfovibrio sp. JC010 TaxID=2593641 RepID=UPI0013D3BB5E|nr:hypothetical protein [Desulfovibrio sp. JC010]NDV28334.1 hypothetical protein [Desulfovibrio sp. JC010]